MYQNRQTIFSPDRRHRYTLWRDCGVNPGDLFSPKQADPGYVQFIGLNPSTADETADDPTIRRCIAFVRDWGYSALCMTNLFAFRATRPADMKLESDPVGPDNQRHVVEIAAGAALVIAAWGRDGRHREMDQTVMLWMRQAGVTLHCLGQNDDQTPKHPLYLLATTKPIPFP